MKRCTCDHFNDIHNKSKNEFTVDDRWKALHTNGCRAANCRCLTFKEKKKKDKV